MDMQDYQFLNVEDIQLDYENPRIKNYLELYPTSLLGSDEIAMALGAGDSGSYAVLKESIRVNRGIINPIIVNKKSDGTMVVIEGNTRVQIYKEFAEANPKDDAWKTIKALVHSDLDDLNIHAIRLQSHLVGPRPWNPYSKAKYLHKLCYVDSYPMDHIVAMCGGNKAEIANLIDAFVDMDKVYRPIMESLGEEGVDPQEFSKFVEFQKKKTKLSIALAKNNFSKKDFAQWVAKGKIDRAEDVRKLSDILLNNDAKQEFLKSGTKKASTYLSTLETHSTECVSLETLSIYEIAKELDKKLANIPYDEVKSLRKDPLFDDKKNMLLNLYDRLAELKEDIE